ncbi:MAG: sulfite exporter TauE/SafE family protein [Rhodobiaceae bacterium]|nr:sulfite exporter TauE/SafE family protein [Rhodobiaceae bacterium]
MLFGFPIGDLAMFAGALALAGVVAGLAAGLLGVGGGAVMVPVLFQFFELLGIDPDVCMHLALGTSLGIIVPTSVRSFRAHQQRGAVDMELLKAWIVPVILGVAGASLIAAWISGAGLRAIFAIIALAVAVKLFFAKADWRLGDDIPGGIWRPVFGFVIGFFSTLMGIGGGTFNNTLMTLYNRPMHQAVATSSGLGFLIAVPATLGFIYAGWGKPDLPPFSLGYVNFLGILLVIPTSMYFAPLGAKVAHSLSRRRLEMAFAIFLTIVSVRFFISLM